MENEKDNKSQMDLIGLADMVDHNARKIAFLREFFVHNVPDDELFCKDARAGFHFIMDDLKDDLDFIVNQLYKIYATDSIREKKSMTTS